MLNILTYTKILISLLTSKRPVNSNNKLKLNKLSNFQFSVNYKPGIQNNVAESLSRFPKSRLDLEEYRKICLAQETKAICHGSINQTNGEDLWIPLINKITVEKNGEEDQLLYNASDKTVILTTQNLRKSQKDESWIKSLFEVKNNGTKVEKADIQKEEREVEVMLKDIEKLEFNENDFLQRRVIDDSRQLLFPEKVKTFGIFGTAC